MSLDQVVNINISRSAAPITRQGFGTLLIMSTEPAFSEKARIYTSLEAVAEDLATSTAAYKAAKAAFSQNPKPTKVMIGKKNTLVAQVMNIVPSTITHSATYKVTIDGVDYTYTADESATKAEIAAGLIAAIGTTPANVGATAGASDTIDLTAKNAGEGFSCTVDAKMTLSTTTANAGIQEDLNTIMATQGLEDWYCLILCSRTPGEILAAASWIEAQRRIFIACSNDADIVTAVATDIASLLKARSFARTALLLSADQANMPEAGWAGALLAHQPGSATWKFKVIAGAAVDTLTTTKITIAKGKNCNIYTNVGGAPITEEGVMAVGEFIDVIVGCDWIQANMQADIYDALRSSKKIAFTDNGISVITSIVNNTLQLAVKRTILSASPAPVVVAPLAQDVPTADKAARLLQDVTFSGTLAGAIHAVKIEGSVSV